MRNAEQIAHVRAMRRRGELTAEEALHLEAFLRDHDLTDIRDVLASHN